MYSSHRNTVAAARPASEVPEQFADVCLRHFFDHADTQDVDGVLTDLKEERAWRQYRDYGAGALDPGQMMYLSSALQHEFGGRIWGPKSGRDEFASEDFFGE